MPTSINFLETLPHNGCIGNTRKSALKESAYTGRLYCYTIWPAIGIIR